MDDNKIFIYLNHAGRTQDHCREDVPIQAGPVYLSIQVGVNVLGHERRYCYELTQDAREAMAARDGQGHPPGPWIKCKTASQELLNPAWTAA